jgi:drug/metabolite transporter (DMT)-like permease
MPEGRHLLDPDTLAKLAQPLNDPDPLRKWAVFWTVPYHALFASVIAFLVMMRFQKEVPPTRAVIIYCLEPVFAAWLAWWLHHEGMKSYEVWGALLVIVGNLACEWLRRNEGPVPPRPEEAMPRGTPEAPPPGRS